MTRTGLCTALPTDTTHRRHLLVHITGLAMAFVGTACGTPRGDERGGTGTLQFEAKYRVPKSLADLVARSEVIVIGSMSDRGEIFNTARDQNDSTKEDPQRFHVGQMYHVRVDRYLKGGGEHRITVVQVEGWIDGPTPRTKENIEKARAQHRQHVPLRPDTRYLMFLVPGGSRARFGQDYFAPPYQPWRFTVPPGGDAEPESPWHGAKGMFPPRPAAEFIAEVERLVGAQP